MTHGYPIPEAALARHIACVGETGSGKTHDTKTLIEHVVGQGYRVCVLDTIKSDWWGITSSASGKRAGLPFTILGGPRGHVPLHSSAGKAIGQLVGEGKLPLSIIDMADFEPGGPQRFFEHFAQALWRHTKGVVYLVIEEAHEIAPKERAGFGAENMAIHWAKKLATGSRTKGIRLIIASQRTQAVHNALLGSCGTLMAHSLSLPADQKPIIDWLKANVRDQSLQKTIENDLAFLPTGTAWVCCAKDGFFKKIHFPKIATFDNTATPDKDAADFDVATTSVDAGALRAIIGDAVKDAEANDPKILKGRIVALERELAVASRIVLPAAAMIDVDTVQREAHSRGMIEGRAEAWVTARTAINKLACDINGWAADMQRQIDALAKSLSEYTGKGEPSLPSLRNPLGAIVREQSLAAPFSAEGSGSTYAKTNGDGKLKGSHQRVIDAIAWWRKIGKEPIERDRAAVVAGLSPRASTFGVYVAELVKMGYVETSLGGVSLTPGGVGIANHPTDLSTKGLRDMARALLAPQEQKIFDIVYDVYPNPIRREDVAKAAGLSPIASTCGVYIAGVAAYGIIEPAERGAVRAADWLFP